MKKRLLLCTLVSMIVMTACNKQESIEIVPDTSVTPAESVKKTDDAFQAMHTAFTVDNEKTDIFEEEALLLTNHSTNAVSYEWDFGNGDTSTEAQPSYQYKIHGAYTITLTTTDAMGNTQKASQDIYVLCIFGGGSHDE